jgi:hypothetical protein
MRAVNFELRLILESVSRALRSSSFADLRRHNRRKRAPARHGWPARQSACSPAHDCGRRAQAAACQLGGWLHGCLASSRDRAGKNASVGTASQTRARFPRPRIALAKTTLACRGARRSFLQACHFKN